MSGCDTGRFAGMGLIAPDALYCTVAWKGVDDFARQQPRSWKAVRDQIRAGFSPQFVPRCSWIYGVLAGFGAGAVNVQYVSKQPIGAENRDQIVDALDQLLQSQVRDYDSTRRHSFGSPEWTKP
jgi:hypothetical protein